MRCNDVLALYSAPTTASSLRQSLDFMPHAMRYECAQVLAMTLSRPATCSFEVQKLQLIAFGCSEVEIVNAPTVLPH
jgi:hypothetical protein